MSYDAEILADSPLAYWKVDEEAGASVVADSSGNGFDIPEWDGPGGFESDPQWAILGPIETDSPNYGAAGRVGRYPAPMPSGLTALTTFTDEVWGRCPSSGVSVLLCLNGEPGLSGSNFIQISTSGVSAMVTLGGTSYTLTYSQTLTPGAWYHCVVTRSGASVILYVQGTARAQTGSASTGDRTVPAGAQWSIGMAQSTSFYSNTGVARAAHYDAQLSAARVLAHYEAAKLSLPLRGTIVVRVGVELDTEEPALTEFPFLHNYARAFGGGADVPITEEIAYRTNVNQSEPDYQQRIGARPHGAYRTFEYAVTPGSRNARQRLQAALYGPGRRYPVAWLPDAVKTTSEAASGQNTIECDTTKRDFEVGSYVYAWTDSRDPATFQRFEIAAVADDALTLAADVETTLPAGSWVAPARQCVMEEGSLGVKSHAADHETFHLRFSVIETELSTRRVTAYTPSATYLGTEVFNLESARVSFLDERDYQLKRRVDSPARDYQYAKDTGSPHTFPVRMLFQTRAALSEFYGWLDARQGKLNPLWVSTSERDFTAVARPTGATLQVTKTGWAFHHGRRHLEILKTDGTYARLRITAVTDNGDGTETLAAAAPSAFPVVAEIARVSFLRYCTLAADAVELRYWRLNTTGGVVVECVASFMELLTSPA